MTRRSGSGPAPDPRSLREAIRQEAGLVQTLPRARSGKAPVRPLAVKATPVERSLWLKLWKLPQAIIWEEHGAERQVARYVRHSIVAEAGDASAAKVKSVLEQERILLLELGSLLKAGYRISSGAVATSGPRQSPALVRNIPSSRGRLRALDPPTSH